MAAASTLRKASVLITGASTGIGRDCALFVDARGYRVFAGVRREADSEALRKAASGNLVPLILDVTSPEQIAAAVETVRHEVGAQGLQGLINNAGVAAVGPVEFLPLDEWRHQMEVNFLGVIAVTQAFLPLLRLSPQARIINMSSFGGSVSSPFLGPYHASKFALEAMSDSLRMELARTQIKVAVIKPAAVKTPIWQKAVKDKDRLLRDMPPEAETYYGYAIDAMVERAQDADKTGASTDVVNRAVWHALTSESPRTRYAVVVNGWILAFLRLLPDRWRDRLTLGRLGLRES